MYKHLQKSLQDYFSQIKKSTRNNQPSSNSFSLTSKDSILSRCKHPKTLSFAIDRSPNEKSINNNNNKDSAATLLDIDRFLYENFRSLYAKDDEEDNKMKNEEDDEDKSPSAIFLESPRFIKPPPDLCGSHRIFMASGLSGSLMEEVRNSWTTNFEDTGSTSITTSTLTNTIIDHSSRVSDDSKYVKLPDGCVAVLASSQSPYKDFRCSMKEIVEARLQQQAKVDWDFMEELLFCYSRLNEKKSYKFILEAFVDLIISLRQNPNKIPVTSQNKFWSCKRKEEREKS